MAGSDNILLSLQWGFKAMFLFVPQQYCPYTFMVETEIDLSVWVNGGEES